MRTPLLLAVVLVIAVTIAVPVGLLTTRSKSDAGSTGEATQDLEESREMPSSAPSLSPAPSSEPPSQCYIEYSNANNTDAQAKVVYSVSSDGTVLKAPYFVNTIDVEYKSTPEPNDIINTPHYFNYNASEGARYGPANWHNVDTTDDDTNYWEEWDYTENLCNVGLQSPIDLCTEPELYCHADHEIRNKVRLCIELFFSSLLLSLF